MLVALYFCDNSYPGMDFSNPTIGNPSIGGYQCSMQLFFFCI